MQRAQMFRDWGGLLAIVLLGLQAPMVRLRCGEESNPESSSPSKEAGPVRSSIAPTSPLGKASEELMSLQHKLRELRGKSQEDRKSQEERLKEILAEGRAVQRTLDGLNEQVAKREKEASEKRSKVSADETAARKLKGPSQAIFVAMKDFLDRVEKHVEAGIPWKIEARKASIAQAREILAAPNAALASALQTVARIHTEEEALGRLVESGTVEIDLGYGRAAVQAFHLGLLGVIFANEDGSVLGFAQAGQKLEDGLASVKGNPAAAEGYMIAVDILRRRRTPSIVDLYVPSLPLRKAPSAKEDEK